MLTQMHAAARGKDVFDPIDGLPEAADSSCQRGARAEAGIGIAVVGADDRIEYCNADYPKIWGLPPGALADYARLADSARDRMNAILFRQDAIRTRNVVRYGDGRWLELVSVSVRASFGPGFRRVMFVRDVTERQAAEERGHRLGRVLRLLAGMF